MDLKQIKLIVDLMKRSDLTDFAVEEEGFKLKIRRGNNGVPIVSQNRNSNQPFGFVGDSQSPLATSAQGIASAPPIPFPSLAAEETGITYVKSPMVGTFYRSASPENKAFADVGTTIAENSPVCIIEAMKIMNEIQAETKGTIVDVLIENGQPVEYGQKLFKVRQG